MAIKIPILKIDDVLIASIYVALDDRSVMEFQHNVLERIATDAAFGVVIDLSAVDLVDSFMARSLNDIASGARLLGANVAIVGLQPDIAWTLVEMGITIRDAITTLDLQTGIDRLRQRPRGQRS